jgi:hypothetical protein
MGEQRTKLAIKPNIKLRQRAPAHCQTDTYCNLAKNAMQEAGKKYL